MKENKFIDVDKVLKEKLPGLFKWLPKFTRSYLKKKLHEDEINKIMHELKDLHGLEYNSGILEKFGVKVEAINAEYIPTNQRIILAGNHPLGGLDGMAFVKTIGEVRPDVHFVVNDVLKNLKNYGDIFVGINKIKKTSHRSLRTMESVLDTDETLGIFPAGLVSREQDGVVKDLDWKKGFVTQAIDHDRLIIPVFIEGENSSSFYRFSKFKKRLGIKANIEMILLPDEMFKQKGKTIKVHFGKPINPKTLNKTKPHRTWARHIKEYIYSHEFNNQIPFEEYISNLSKSTS